MGFKPPVVITEVTVVKKVKAAWETANKIVWKQITKKSQTQAFKNKLDKILDITKCRCTILACSQYGCAENCRRCKDCGRCGLDSVRGARRALNATRGLILAAPVLRMRNYLCWSLNSLTFRERKLVK